LLLERKNKKVRRLLPRSTALKDWNKNIK